MLALSDEDGWLSFVDTSSQLPTCLDDSRTDTRPKGQWYAHNNAIFDIAWCKVRWNQRGTRPCTQHHAHVEPMECFNKAAPRITAEQHETQDDVFHRTG